MSRQLSVLAVGELIADIMVQADDQGSLPPGPDDALATLGAVGASPPSATTASDQSTLLRLVAWAGGSPTNVAVALARLGIPVGLAGRLSRVGLGPWLTSCLSANGVDLSLSTQAAQPPTLAMVALDATGSATYAFYGPHTADWQWRRDELPAPANLRVAAIHTGSLTTALRPGADTLAAWVDDVHATHRVLISYDPNVRLSCIGDIPAFAGGVRSWVARSHLVKVSEEDLASLHPDGDALSVATHWAGIGPDLVVLTRGSQPPVALRPDGSSVVGPTPVGPVVDTVGAGDAFSAGLLAWLAEAGALHPGGPAALRPAELRRALDVACRVASATCSRRGADPPRRSEVADAPWPARASISR
ncbi:MAG: carbohydrate kinase [Candidatus Dormibacteria bacterium]|jgi:fructokinase